MIFTKLTLENYGLFRGEHTFDLMPESSEKPIILFGGKNGAGKTTLFEAFRLCLYGKSFQGTALSDLKYEKHLKSRIHRYPGLVIQPDKTSVTLQFRYVQFGRTDSYSVKRFWQDTGKHVKESIEIFKNGQPLSDIETDQWQEFVKELIPLGVTKLFFFDGEQIQNLAEDGANNLYLKDSFDSLAGLGVIERLRLDLRYILSRTYRQSDGDGSHEVDLLYSQHQDLKKQLDAVEANTVQIESKINYLNGQLQKQEQLIAQEGGGYATKREELKTKKNALDAEIAKVQEKIRELASGLLPFALTPDYCKRLKEQLILEEGYAGQIASQKSIEKNILELQNRLASDKFWSGLENDVTNNIRSKILNRLLKNVEEVLALDKNLQEIRMVHNLSAPERQKLLTWADEVFNRTPAMIKDLTQSLEKLTRDRQEIEKFLVRSPPDEVLHPYIQELNKLSVELGAEQQKLAHETKAKSELKFKITEIVNKLYKEYDKQDAASNVSTKEQLARKIQQLLDEYLIRIRERKLKDLQEHLVTALNHLSHKKIFENVKISPLDFSVILYDLNDDEIPKDQLSAGEKQIYAIAMLWALAKTSGRPLPFIIDTPLGRLDSDHRTNLVANFFPVASHQVIIFSTNTEIDEKYFEELEPFISHAYLVGYDRKQGHSVMTEGYFWKFKKKEMMIRRQKRE